MNSNGNAPRKGSVKKKKTVVQKAASFVLKVIEGKDKKKAPPKHAVRGPQRPPQRNGERPVRMAYPSDNANRRPVSEKTTGKATGRPVSPKPNNNANRRPVAPKPAQRPTQQARNIKTSNKKTVVRPIKGKKSLQDLASFYIRKLLRMKKKLYIGAAVAVVLLIILILSRTVLFKIDNIVVTNPSDVSYTSEQISMETGIVSGTQNLFSCDLEKVEKNIETRLPYIGDAVVKRDFPSSLEVTVTPTSVSAAIVYGTGYLLIDENGKILENTQITPDGVPTLRTSIEISPDVGYYLGDESRLDKDADVNPEKDMINLFSTIVDAAEKAGLIDGITTIDIRDPSKIILTYENRLSLHLGNESMLEKKLNTGAKIIATETDSTRNRTGAINLEKVGIGVSNDAVEDMTEFAEITENKSEN